MTSPGHKIGQILKVIYLRQYLSYCVDQKLKMSEMFMAIFLVYSISGITSRKKSFSGSKWRPFWKFWNIKHSFNLTSDMKRSSQIMTIKFFYGDDVIDDVTGWPQSFSLFSCLGEVGSGSKLITILLQTGRNQFAFILWYTLCINQGNHCQALEYYGILFWFRFLISWLFACNC